MEAWRSPDSGFWNELSAGATLGKCIPLWSRKVGRSFPERSLWESMSHSGREFRDVLSAWSRSGNGIPFWSQIPGSTFHQESQREAHPIPSINSGMRFPPATGSAKKGSIQPFFRTGFPERPLPPGHRGTESEHIFVFIAAI